MTSNHLYNLAHQLVTENKTLWRIQRNYQKDHDGCPDCDKFWKKLEQDKQDHVKELEGLLKKHLE